MIGCRIFPPLLIITLLRYHPIQSSRDSFTLSGYIPDYRSINLNATSIHLTDLMLFSVAPESVRTKNGCCVSSDRYELARKARSYKLEMQNEALRLLVTVGGGGRSDGFSEIIVNGDGLIQNEFVDALVELCKSEDLDGIDLDYEGIQSLDEWKAYLALILRVGKEFHRRGLYLSVALHPGQFLPPKVCESVDRVHLMAYDMIGGPNQHTGHHAEITVVQDALKSFIDRGCPPTKLVLGIPAYARHAQNPSDVKTFYEIFDEYLNINEGLEEGSFQSIGSVSGYYFDSPDAVRSKVQYAKANGLGGIFFWELGQDKQHSDDRGGILLRAAASANKEPSPSDEL